MLIPVGSATAEIEVRRSRFIAIATPVEESEAMRALISETRSLHPQANHVVHAAIMGRDGSQFSFSDDREPKNTAGRPMLEVLRGSGITNLLVMVVRYFGGTELGTGGLVRAYSEVTKAVLEVLKTEELIDKESLEIVVDYDIYEQVEKLLKEKRGEMESLFETQVTIKVTLPAQYVDEVTLQITNLSSGSATIRHCPDSQ
ncbi:MAG: YigZ family protein [Spirochaetales bacterium]|nr:YigZ family protein [Spirochaetales bacterium]